MIDVDYASRAYGALADRHIEGVDHKLGVLDGVDGLPDEPETGGVHDAAAVNLPFSRGTFRDVTDPEFILPRSGEPTFDQIIACRYACVPTGLDRAREPVDTSVMHQSPDQPLADPNAASLGEFSTHVPRPVRVPQLGADLPDQRREKIAGYQGRRRWPVVEVALT